MDRHLTEAPEVVLFLESLYRDGFELSVQRDRLRIRPNNRLSEDLVAALQRHKPALLALLAPVTEFVTLKGGLTVPVPALKLVLDFEARGFQMSVDAGQQFVIEPAADLTDADQAGLHRWRRHLAALVGYQCPDSELPQ